MSLPLDETEAPITDDFSNCTVNAMVGEAVGKLYVAEHFPPEATVRIWKT